MRAATAGAPLAAHWRAAWRRAAAAHVAAWACCAIGQAVLSSSLALPERSSSSSSSYSLHLLGQQLMWVAVAGAAASEGPPALLAALRPDDVGGGAAAPIDKRAALLCCRVAGLACLMLQGTALVMGHWVQCAVHLLVAVPLYALTALHPSTGAAIWLVLLVATVLGGTAAAWQLLLQPAGIGSAWLSKLLLPHLLLVASTLMA